MACIKVITEANNSNTYKAREPFDKRSGPGLWLAGGSIPFVLIILVTFCIKTKSNAIAASDTN